MARLNTIFIAALLVQSPVHAADLCATGAKHNLSMALNQVCRALSAVNTRNRVLLRELMADDFALTSVSGKYFEASRDEMISRWTAAAAADVVGTTALTTVFRTYQTPTFGFVAGEMEDRTQEGTAVVCEVHTFTDIWELRGSHWKWVQSHESGYRKVSCGE